MFRHCERSEAISIMQVLQNRRDSFVASLLAKTKGQRIDEGADLIRVLCRCLSCLVPVCPALDPTIESIFEESCM